jgi:sulfur relay (sulfurtransferase) complex TusBCD TusD component (DsrE family)
MPGNALYKKAAAACPARTVPMQPSSYEAHIELKLMCCCIENGVVASFCGQVTDQRGIIVS